MKNVDGVGNVDKTGKYTFTSKQSPKIKSGILRAQNKDNTVFSLIDVPIGFISRGTKLNEQYIRRNETELNKLFNTVEQDKELNSCRIYINNSVEPGNEDNNNHNHNNRNIRTANMSSFRNKILVNDDKDDSNHQININKRINSTNEPFKHYERLSKTSQTQRGNSKLPSIKDIKDRMLESDIFFVKKTDEKINRSNSERKTDKQDSDIFMIKNNEISWNKCGEKYLLKNNNKDVFSITSNSNSQWLPKNSYPSLINHSSTNYHILNPGIKNIFKTKEIIKEESIKSNPIFRQKSICEIVDLTRVGCPNSNKEYQKAFSKSKNIFNRNSNLCAMYLDIGRSYKNLSDEPFGKKII